MKRHLLFVLPMLPMIPFRAHSQPSDLPGRKLERSEPARTLVTIRLDYRQYSSDEIAEILKLNGVQADESSKVVFTHLETGDLDLHCFDCIIGVRTSAERPHAPENELLRQAY